MLVIFDIPHFQFGVLPYFYMCKQKILHLQLVKIPSYTFLETFIKWFFSNLVLNELVTIFLHLNKYMLYL